MRLSPEVVVMCDGCGYEDAFPLTALARGSYDERNLDGSLEREGWLVEDGRDYCPDCAEGMEADDDDSAR